MNTPTLLSEEIKNLPWFNELTPLQVERLAGISTILTFQPGDIVFQEGDRADNLFIILSGKVVLENYIPSLGKQIINSGEPLDVIGWSCLTPIVRQRTATARICQPSRMLMIAGEALLELNEKDHDLGYLIMRRVANIVATQFLATRLHLYDIIQNKSHSLAQSNLF